MLRSKSLGVNAARLLAYAQFLYERADNSLDPLQAFFPAVLTLLVPVYVPVYVQTGLCSIYLLHYDSSAQHYMCDATGHIVLLCQLDQNTQLRTNHELVISAAAAATRSRYLS